MSEESATGEFDAPKENAEDAGRVNLDYVQEYDTYGALGETNRGLQLVLLIIAAVLAIAIMIGVLYLILPGVYEA